MKPHDTVVSPYFRPGNLRPQCVGCMTELCSVACLAWLATGGLVLVLFCCLGLLSATTLSPRAVCFRVDPVCFPGELCPVADFSEVLRHLCRSEVFEIQAIQRRFFIVHSTLALSAMATFLLSCFSYFDSHYLPQRLGSFATFLIVVLSFSALEFGTAFTLPVNTLSRNPVLGPVICLVAWKLMAHVACLFSLLFRLSLRWLWSILKRVAFLVLEHVDYSVSRKFFPDFVSDSPDRALFPLCPGFDFVCSSILR